ncbi:unnamed protein product, partial [Rotaria magnacalcarata]
MEAVAKAILAAREEILIACWLISPEVKLVRPYDDDDGSMRLVSLLNKRAKIEKLQSAACEWKSSTRNGQQRAGDLFSSQINSTVSLFSYLDKIRLIYTLGDELSYYKENFWSSTDNGCEVISNYSHGYAFE